MGPRLRDRGGPRLPRLVLRRDARGPARLDCLAPEHRLSTGRGARSRPDATLRVGEVRHRVMPLRDPPNRPPRAQSTLGTGYYNAVAALKRRLRNLYRPPHQNPWNLQHTGLK